ncbi:class I SAM-dependent methyltransferase [Phenylobacterium aquaticum]|uniref:class I SAM-dependent methyltransferase n=1 Tax=Phenylobacterium aquaticum TaxID=1763816 RepID=UPI0026EAA283|nr:class I SAM-dependent methyltransferase [Phenylobacterium aquaticum]
MAQTRARHPHSHMWLIGVLGLAAGAALMIYAPRLKGISTSILLFAGFHLIGAVVILSSLYGMALRDWIRGLRKPALPAGDALEFGWGPGWMNGLAVAALVALAAAVAVQVSKPELWPISFLLVVQAVLFLFGNTAMSGFRRPDHMVLPMVDLVRGETDRVLDAGCGAGRTTIALSRVLRGGRVTALDRFDADYIDDGGRALLDRNLKIAGLTERVEVVTGDLTAMPFPQGDFDAAVSTNVYDHLGGAKQQGLAETWRVLKPGGRFLMAVWTPGPMMFTIGSLFSFLLTPKSAWREMGRKAGFAVIDEGAINGCWWVLFEKPVA